MNAKATSRQLDENGQRIRLWIPECRGVKAKESQLLYPFNGPPTGHDGYDIFAEHGRKIFQRTSIQSADFAVLPFDGNILVDRNQPSEKFALTSAQEIVDCAAQHGLKTIVIANTDSTRPMPLSQPDILVFRPSILRSKRRSNEFALPAWHDDLFSRYCKSGLQTRPWRAIPSVGFCGHAGQGRPPFTRRVKMILQRIGVRIPHNDGIWLRSASMAALRRSSAVETSFIVRDRYFGGPSGSGDDNQRRREEYVHNILDNDYALSVRGWGNHSFRAYEALSLGRPVLFLDTDCVLPLEELINYDEVLLRISERDLHQLSDRLANFHRSLDPSAFVKMQIRARDVWERFLSPLGFYRSVIHLLAARAR